MMKRQAARAAFGILALGFAAFLLGWATSALAAPSPTSTAYPGATSDPSSPSPKDKAKGKEKQLAKQTSPTLPDQKVVRAVRSDSAITIDGRLDEPVWQGPAAEGFTQSDPKDGDPSSERTQVWVAYDDHAIYVAAFCHDSEPAKIIGRLGRRDGQTDSDWFSFCVDPYYDRRSGYQFIVNPSGAIQDYVLSNDISEDETWDGVWEVKTRVNGQGWTAEMKVPFNQIRFPKKDEYVWGVNFQRMIRRKNERDSYAWVPKSDSAFVSRFARLEGLRGISPGRQVEMVPYAVANAQYQPAEPGNPFQTGHRMLGNVGFDLKAGLKSNLTLDATVNPDFGQVEVDPAVVNLTAYETYFQEKRPFFIEGASLFRQFGRGGVYLNANINWPDPMFFYSRRIGRAPQGYVTEDGYSDIPVRTAILGAAKVTGKLGGSWNVSMLSALTAREEAQVDQGGTRLSQEVEPFTFYGAFRAQKEIDGGKSGIGIIATGVTRDLTSTSTTALTGLLNKDAFTLGMDGWTFLDKKRDWVVGGWAGGTRVAGTAEDITRLQESSMHYYQRPDATHVELDPTATSLSGWGTRFNIGKQNGDWLFLASAGALSPGFDPNDVGFQYGGSDVIQVQALPGRQWTKPSKLFQNCLLIGGYSLSYDFGGNRTWEAILGSFQGVLRNFWEFNVMLAYNPYSVSNDRTRGGPLSLTPWGYQIDAMLSTNTRAPIVLEGQSSYYKQSDWGYQWNGQLAVRWKPRSNINLSVGPTLYLQTNDVQWVTRAADETMTSTYGSRYVFGRIDQQVLGTEIRVDWTFTPRLTLQAYIQPYLAVGAYDQFKELARPKSYDYNIYGQANGSTIGYENGLYTVDPDGPGGPAQPFMFGNPDFNYKSLRGTVVFRWEYRPGSLIYFVWTQNKADFADPGNMQLWHDLGNLFSAPGQNVFLLKVTYRWNL